MRIAATFLLSVTVFTALFLESSTNPLESGADVDVVNMLTVALAPIENAIETVAELKGEVRNAVEEAAASIKLNLNIKFLCSVMLEVISNAIGSTDAALVKVGNAIDAGLAKTKDPVEKEALNALNVWLGELVSLCEEVHDAIKDAVTIGTKESLEEGIPTVQDAIDATVENLEKQRAILEATPGKNVKNVLKVLDSAFVEVLANADVVLNSMVKVVAAW